MGEVIWVEVLTRGGDVAGRHRGTGPELRIGRGYGNDVILDDPFVAPEHLRVFRDAAGALAVESLSPGNGMFVGRSSEPAPGALATDGVVRIGRTALRIRDASHAVPAERPMPAHRREWPAAVAILTAIIAIEVLSLWLNEVNEFRISRYATSLVGALVAVLGWSALWSILTRIFAGHMRFERNLLIASAGLLTYSLLNEVLGLLPFALSWDRATALEFVGLWCILAVVVFLHLREIGPARLRLKGGLVAGIAVIGIATQLLGQIETRAVFRPAQAMRLFPPAFRLAPAQDETAFFGDIAKLKAKLDVDRTKDPADAPGLFTAFED